MGGHRIWSAKSRSFPRRTFVATESLVVFGDTTVVSLDARTGKERAKAKWARCGEPWVEGGDVWVPTTKGLWVLDAVTLETKRELSVPRPKVDGETLLYWGTLDGISGDTIVRVGRPKNPLNRAGTFRYYLTASRAGEEQPIYTTLLTESSAQVHGALAGGVAVCAWPVVCGETKTFQVVARSAADGSALTEASTTDIGLVQPLGETVLVPRHGKPSLVYSEGKLAELPSVGRAQRVGDRVYVVGTREIVRCGEAYCAASRRKVRTPASEVDANRLEPSSLALGNRGIRLVERVPPLLESWNQRGPEPRVEYVTRLVDADSLADAGPEQTFEEDAWFKLIGWASGVWIAQIPGGFTGCRFADG